jgi:hypothetical protein
MDNSSDFYGLRGYRWLNAIKFNNSLMLMKNQRLMPLESMDNCKTYMLRSLSVSLESDVAAANQDALSMILSSFGKRYAKPMQIHSNKYT